MAESPAGVADEPAITPGHEEGEEQHGFEPGSAGLAEGVVARVTPSSSSELRDALVALGWPAAMLDQSEARVREAVEDFQRAFAFWLLSKDGIAGPKTWEAIEHSLAFDGRTSPNFRFREFASRCNGWIKLSRVLVLGLEEYRELVGGAVYIRSGYRDPECNKKAGGAVLSQHLWGCAADLDPLVPWQKVKALQCFSGIGIMAATGHVRHVDVRHVCNNTTGGTTRYPTTWNYA